MLGERIAKLRRQSGFSQRELAAYLKVSPSAVGMYEQDRREPSAGRLVAMAALFDVSLDYLLTGVPDDPDQREALRQWYQDMAQSCSLAELVDENGQSRPLEQRDLAMMMAALLQHGS